MSPTARITSNIHLPSTIATAPSSSSAVAVAATSSDAYQARHASELYAEPQCYTDFEHNTPFLIRTLPSTGAGQAASNANDDSTTTTTRVVVEPSCPLQSETIDLLSSMQVMSPSAPMSPSTLSLNHVDANILEAFDLLGNERNTAPSAPHASATSSAAPTATASFSPSTLQHVTVGEQSGYYMDEKPPAYEDIIKNDVSRNA